MNGLISPYPVATNSNRTSSQGIAPTFQRYKTSQIVRVLLSVGQTLPVPVAGDRFYVVASSYAVQIRPGNMAENLFYPGTGLKLDPQNAFDILHLRNSHASNAVYLELFVGFDEYDDRRLTFPSVQFSQVFLPVYDYIHPALSGGATANLVVPDRSGQVVTQLDGTKFYALSRQLLILFNDSASVNHLLSYFSAGPGFNYCGVAYPKTSLQLPVTGALRVLTQDGSNLAAYISEVYNCLPVPT
jgi:hypothetical protein